MPDPSAGAESSYAVVSRFAADWGNILGALIQTAVVVAGGAWTYRRYREGMRARFTDFHVILRRIDKVTASDSPIDSPGHWVVFANGTGAPVSWWRLVVTDDRHRVFRLSSEQFGPILPTPSMPQAYPVQVQNLEDDVGLTVKEWRFRSGDKYWRRGPDSARAQLLGSSSVEAAS